MITFSSDANFADLINSAVGKYQAGYNGKTWPIHLHVHFVVSHGLTRWSVAWTFNRMTLSAYETTDPVFVLDDIYSQLVETLMVRLDEATLNERITK